MRREKKNCEKEDTELDEIFSKNRIEDVSWLCSLSESELDMLISLKTLILQRAKIAGHEELAKKFDLRMLRALGLTLMEFFKGKVKDLSPGLAVPASFMDGCNFLNCNTEDIMSDEEIKACVDINPKKKACDDINPKTKAGKRPCEESDNNQEKKKKRRYYRKRTMTE